MWAYYEPFLRVNDYTEHDNLTTTENITPKMILHPSLETGFNNDIQLDLFPVCEPIMNKFYGLMNRFNRLIW